MELKDVLSLRWKTLEDWSGLKASIAQNFVSKEDIDEFVDNTFHAVAQNLNIPYEQLLPILQQKNQQFFQLKERSLFKKEYAYPINSKEVNMLKNSFRIPSIENDKVLTCLIQFEKLSPKEQKEFLAKAEHLFSSRT